MQVRRCGVAWLEPREVARFEFADLLAGGGVTSRMAWFAHAPHLVEPVEIDEPQLLALGTVGPVDWVDRDQLADRVGHRVVEALVSAGLLVSSATDRFAHVDADVRHHGWHAPAAIAHMASRWSGVDGPAGSAAAGLGDNEGLLRRHGVPPAHMRPAPDGAVALPAVERDGFDALLDTRATCRNYGITAQLPLATFSQVMARVFGARGLGHPAEGFDVIKRTSPSGGALHPTECWLIVQRVEGITPGLYRYRIDGHALEPVVPGIAPPQRGDAATTALGDGTSRAWSAEELRAFARIAVAGQDWFADAPVLCALAPRFHRNFWKYRNHAKAYRVCALDVGHLSQTLQLCATQAGLGPFVTSAINEIDIERAFGLVGYAESPLAVVGFGLRAEAMTVSEFDPNRRVWSR